MSVRESLGTSADSAFSVLKSFRDYESGDAPSAAYSTSRPVTLATAGGALPGPDPRSHASDAIRERHLQVVARRADVYASAAPEGQHLTGPRIPHHRGASR